MRRLRADDQIDETLLRTELASQPGAIVRKESGGLFIEHDEMIDGIQIDYAVRRAIRRSLAQRVRQAKSVTEVRDAVADALQYFST